MNAHNHQEQGMKNSNIRQNLWQIAAVTTVLVAGLAAVEAQAFVHTQLLVGSSKGHFDGGGGLSGNYRTTEVNASFQFDYFPQPVPVTFGFFVGHKALRLSETGSSINRADQWSVGPELMAWYPGFDVKPYLKAGIGFGSYTALEAGSVNSGSRAWYASFARRASLGAKWDPYPKFAPLVEYQINREELENEGATAGLAPNKSFNLETKTILIGFESSF